MAHVSSMRHVKHALPSKYASRTIILVGKVQRCAVVNQKRTEHTENTPATSHKGTKAYDCE